MQRARFSEEQIIGILKAAQAAGNIREACRENNTSEQTLLPLAKEVRRDGGFRSKIEVYDVEVDPGEINGLSADPEYRSRMASLEARLREVADLDLQDDVSDPLENGAPSLDEETRRQLQILGYLPEDD